MFGVAVFVFVLLVVIVAMLVMIVFVFVLLVVVMAVLVMIVFVMRSFALLIFMVFFLTMIVVAFFERNGLNTVGGDDARPFETRGLHQTINPPSNSSPLTNKSLAWLTARASAGVG